MLQLLVAAVLLTGFALVFVFLQIRIQELASEVSTLERRIKSVKERNLALRVQVDRRKSPGSLENQIVYLNLNLVPIESLPQLPVEAPLIRPRGPARMTAMEGGQR
jgi:outer membrane murein-binding lipoprotein Lpp